MKKLTAFILSASILFGMAGMNPYAARLYAADTVNTEEEDAAPEETATPEPDAEETAAPTAEPEDYSGVDNPEDSDDEMGGGINISGSPGATGGLGFEGSRFPDCRGHWAEEIIVEATNKKYLDGYDDGTFGPDDPVTASQFAKIFSAWRGSFYQLTEGYWATPYIRKMLDDGIFTNGEYGNYDTPMTREQVAKAVVSSLKGEYFPSSLSKYEAMITDINDTDDAYREYVVKAFLAGIMGGYDDGSLKPKGYVTRAEILSIIDRTVTPDKRVIPEAVTAAQGEAPEVYTYYTAAVQVRKNTREETMNYRLLDKNAQYMTEDDAVSGLRMSEEMQGANGFAMLMRYDLTDILKREDSLLSVSFVMNHAADGDMELGLFWYENKVSDTNWFNRDYAQVVNGVSVAGSDKAGYNAVVDNISAILPTWGDTENAVPQEQKTQPFARAELSNGKYEFELTLDELKAHMDENNMVQFFVTTVNYDRYGTEDNKPKCYVAGAQAPQLYTVYESDGEFRSTIRVLAETAKVEGGMLNLFGTGEDSYVENFQTNQKMTFDFKADRAGKYKMTIYYSANINSGGGTVHFDINGSEFDHTFAQTGAWNLYVYEDLGEVELKAGNNTMILTDKEIPNTYLINVKNIVFEKVD